MIYSYLDDIKNMPPASVALGFFDGLHLGHAEVIRSVLEDENLTSAVFTFSGIGELPEMKRNEHILTDRQKLILMNKMGVKNIFAPSFSEIKELTPEKFVSEVLIKRINAKSISCGKNFRFGKNRAADTETLKEICRSYGIKAKIISQKTIDNKPISSTYIRHLIKSGEITRANEFLGYEFTVEEEVIHGAMLGRTLGTPTINQLIPLGSVMPRFGVYKSWSEIGGRQYKSLTNIGIKPTVAGANPMPLMETYIIGFDGDLYGKTVKVALVGYIRDEIKFNNIYELKAQIQKDIILIERNI